MGRFSRWFQAVIMTSAFALGLVHCGVEGNPFYALSASSAANDVPDGAMLDDVPDGNDVIQDDVVLADASSIDRLDASDGTVADVVDGAISNSDAADASDVEDEAIDIVLVFPDLATPDVVTPPPDIMPEEDVFDATVAMDVVMTPDIVTVPDIVMMPDVIPAVDVVDASAPIDRPDVLPAMDVVMTPDVVSADTPDVVLMSDRPDVVSLPDVVDVPPAVDIVDVVTPQDVPVIPDFVVEYHSQDGENNVPFGLPPVTAIGASFFVDGRWQRVDLPVVRDIRPGTYVTSTITRLSPDQRRATFVALALPNEGCGSRVGRPCPNNWDRHWEVRWFGVVYPYLSTITRPDAGSAPAYELLSVANCEEQGFSDTGCVRFRVP
jgi:hypothetical protein